MTLGAVTCPLKNGTSISRVCEDDGLFSKSRVKIPDVDGLLVPQVKELYTGEIQRIDVGMGDAGSRKS